ncbi:hypothetical protein P20495_3209 [Pseudoalteromonas sp. BSi20495]|nr:hypothetical protein P20495_3209 [Pseudoalteromonas sp. BSi20495]
MSGAFLSGSCGLVFVFKNSSSMKKSVWCQIGVAGWKKITQSGSI